MINTKPTTNHIKNIKQYKKLLEKWDMWDFAYYDGEDYYFLTLYEQQILRSIKGYLILNSQGEVVPFEKAKSCCYYLILFNTMYSEAISKMVPQMHKDMSPYKETVELLTQNRNELTRLSVEVQESVDRVIEEIAKTLEHPQLIKDIINVAGTYQREVTREKGFFDQEFLKTIRDEFGKYRELMYEYGLRERMLQKDYEIISKALSSNELNINSKMKLKKLLTSAMQSNQQALEKSMKNFEYDEKGNKLTIDPDHIRESLNKSSEEIGIREYERVIVPIIRNPR